MTPRQIHPHELSELLRLYEFLHPGDIKMTSEDSSVKGIWKTINANPYLKYYVAEVDQQLVSTCTLTIILNLTRECRPYGLIENVVTDPSYRKRGYATELLRFALDDAWREGCYKVMLATGSKSEDTLRFYERAGFQRGIKTGFIAYPYEIQT
jgi:GNAT superfamily N-acetyltransferase